MFNKQVYQVTYRLAGFETDLPKFLIVFAADVNADSRQCKTPKNMVSNILFSSYPRLVGKWSTSSFPKSVRVDSKLRKGSPLQRILFEFCDVHSRGDVLRTSLV
jgi:hypothetical protein